MSGCNESLSQLFHILISNRYTTPRLLGLAFLIGTSLVHAGSIEETMQQSTVRPICRGKDGFGSGSGFIIG